MSSDNIPTLTIKDLINVSVIHDKYGLGSIVGVEENYITVLFEKKTAELLFPDAFHSFLHFAEQTDETRFMNLTAYTADESSNSNISIPNALRQSSYAVPPPVRAQHQPMQSNDSITDDTLEKGEKQLETAIEDAIDLFSDFKLTPRSGEELAKFFRYRARHLPSDEQISYNFFVHSNDENSAKRFASLFFNVCHAFDESFGVRHLAYNSNNDCAGGGIYQLPSRTATVPRFSGMAFLTESQILYNDPDKDLVQKSMILISECMPLSAFEAKSEEFEKRKRIWKSFERFCESTPKICKMLCASESVIRERFRHNEHLYFRIFQHHIYFGQYDSFEIEDAVLKQLKGKRMRISDDFRIELKEYISTVYSKADLQGEAFINDLVNRILSNYYGSNKTDNLLTVSDVPYYRKSQGAADGLDNLVGLKDVKEKIKQLESYVRFYQSSRENGITLNEVSLHMVFTGNPGTGKTTVARAIARTFFEIGIIKKNIVVEARRQDLCAEYVGQTAIKTQHVIDRAIGGVLFIDEAYMLSQYNGQDDYGPEAIETIMSAMENRRNELVVIFAGYEDEMKRFIDANSGLASRIGYTFHFPDYSGEEMQEIYHRQMNQQGFICSEPSDCIVAKIWGKAKSQRYSGNGRLVRKVVQAIILKHAARVGKIIEPTQQDYRTICVDDMPSSSEIEQLLCSTENQRPIGFSIN